MLKYKYIFQTKYTEAILSNSTRKLLWFEISKMLIAVLKKFIVSYSIIFGTLSFPIEPPAYFIERVHLCVLLDAHETARRAGPSETADNYRPLYVAIHKVKWRLRIYGQDTFAILWV